jgi:hypothetical protein
MRRTVFVCCFLLAAAAGFGADYGLLLDQTAEYAADENDGGFTYAGILVPWWSSPLPDKKADLYLSAGVQFRYENGEPAWIPELARTEFVWRPRQGMELSLGRVHYSDPLGLVASGLFDGAGFQADLGNGKSPLSGTLCTGIWYSGLLYKKTANITMTDADLASYHASPDREDLWDTWFASSRLLCSLGYTLYPGPLRIDLNALAQFDLNGGKSRYDSQYFQAKISLPYRSLFTAEAGGTAELIETTGRDPTLGMLGEIGFGFMPPGGIPDRISVGLRYSTGDTGGKTVAAFTPVTTRTQGRVLRAKLSGLAAAELGYMARLHQSLALQLEGLYLVRTGLITYTAWPASGDSYQLGAEACARFIWSPVSDLRLNAGGGVFIPAPDSGYQPRWQIQLNAVLALL